MELSVYEERQRATIEVHTEQDSKVPQTRWTGRGLREERTRIIPNGKMEDFWEELPQQNSAGISGQTGKGF